jgi:hypothetical protein
MDRANNILTVKIAGKNQRGEAFEEFARVEPFGSFGMLVHTEQTLALSNVLHICGANGNPIASAEVIWVRGGTTPAVEVLLHRNLDLAELAASISEVTAPTPPLSASASAGETERAAGSTAANIPAATVSAATSSSSSFSSPVTTKSSLSTSSESTEAQSEQISCPNCNKPNPINSKSCKYCGVYLSRSMSSSKAEGKEALGASGESLKSISGDQAKLTSGASLPRFESAPTTSGVRRPREEPASPRANKAVTAKAKEQQQTLAQYRKIAFVALTVLVILLAATFMPGLGGSTPTRIDVVQQSGCLDVNALKRPPANGAATGEMEIWTQSDNGAVQFLRREITAGDASGELDKMARSGLKLHGYWCPKYDSRPANSNEVQLPEILGLPWSLKPVGANAASIGELTLQYKDKTLRLKEIVNQNTLDRTKDIKQATYYSGLQKIVVKFDDTTANVNAPVLRELSFYLPSSQDPAAAAQGQLTNTVRPYYLAQPDTQQGSGAGLLFIIQVVTAIAIALTLLYLLFNFYRSRAL